MRAWAWLRDWTIITVGPWAAIYLCWEGPLILGVAVATLTFFAALDRVSHR